MSYCAIQEDPHPLSPLIPRTTLLIAKDRSPPKCCKPSIVPTSIPFRSNSSRMSDPLPAFPASSRVGSFSLFLRRPSTFSRSLGSRGRHGSWKKNASVNSDATKEFLPSMDQYSETDAATSLSDELEKAFKRIVEKNSEAPTSDISENTVNAHLARPLSPTTDAIMALNTSLPQDFGSPAGVATTAPNFQMLATAHPSGLEITLRYPRTPAPEDLFDPEWNPSVTESPDSHHLPDDVLRKDYAYGKTFPADAPGSAVRAHSPSMGTIPIGYQWRDNSLPGEISTAYWPEESSIQESLNIFQASEGETTYGKLRNHLRRGFGRKKQRQLEVDCQGANDSDGHLKRFGKLVATPFHRKPRSKPTYVCKG